MQIIAHRGNLNGPNHKMENNPKYILNAISKNYHVELDLWYINNILYLGHDKPQYNIDIEFILNIKKSIYCHCKNIDTLVFLLNNYPEIECFFHDKDECVLTSKNKIWNYPGSKLTDKSICVMPENSNQIPENCFGICTDYPIFYSNNNL
tara:strand:+ start:645 stop:1094 length:450 start_codon:yes stop_codon:yes gene_type:complete